MSEEQREILQMVADGKITADDGSKLLEALSIGEKKNREMESPATRVREMKRAMREGMKNAGFTGMSSMSDISRMVRGIVNDAVSRIDDESIEIDENMLEDEGMFEGSIDLEKGTNLVLKRRIRRNGRGDLILVGVEGSSLEIEGENTPDVRLYRDNETVFLEWADGDLSLNIPETVENIRASISGGNITFNGVDAVADIKTKGGNVKLSEVSRAFRTKTMGGDIMILLNDGWNEDSTATTMGGNIKLDLTKGTKAEIAAKTMGGKISVQDGISGINKSGHAGSSRVNIDLTDGEESPRLDMKTMGGNISITRSGTETAKKNRVKYSKKDKKK